MSFCSKIALPAIVSAVVAVPAFSDIVVDASSAHQKIVGFGGGSVYYQNWIAHLGDSKKEELFDTAFVGLNLSILRLGNWLQNDSTGKDIASDVEIVEAGKSRQGDRLKVYMSSWSAPDSIKPSGSVNGQDGATKSDKSLKKVASDPYGAYAYSSFASWWKKSFLEYVESGIPIDYISIQNEPDMEATYAETLFDSTETSELAGYAQALKAVSDTMKTLGEKAPRIWGPEVLGIGYNNVQKYVNALDTALLGGYNYHLYHAGDGNDNSSNNYATPENFRKAMSQIASAYSAKPIVMTEFCTMRSDVLESDMIGLAKIMQIGFTAGNLGGYLAWELFWGEGRGQLLGVCVKGWGNCSVDTIVVSPEYHAMRHYSKFVNPGFARVDLSSDLNSTQVQAVSFASEDKDSISTVIINSGNSPVTTAISANATLGAYALVHIEQSIENGEKSLSVTLPLDGKTLTLPGRSITTAVLYDSQLSAIPSAIQVSGSLERNAVIYDLQGKVVWKGELEEADLCNRELKIEGVRPGFYLLKRGSRTMSVVKQ